MASKYPDKGFVTASEYEADMEAAVRSAGNFKFWFGVGCGILFSMIMLASVFFVGFYYNV